MMSHHTKQSWTDEYTNENAVTALPLVDHPPTTQLMSNRQGACFIQTGRRPTGRARQQAPTKAATRCGGEAGRAQQDDAEDSRRNSHATRQ